MAPVESIKKIIKIDTEWQNYWSFIVDSYNFDSAASSLTSL